MRWDLVAVGAVVIAVTGVIACGTDPVGVDSCRKIEQARCENAPSCGISLDTPTNTGTSDSTKVAACIRYYNDACLHGLAAPSDPGAVQVQACVDAINAGDCSVVVKPESASACAFLVPPSSTPAPAADAASD